jgi:hypothetical protein
MCLHVCLGYISLGQLNGAALELTAPHPPTYRMMPVGRGHPNGGRHHQSEHLSLSHADYDDPRIVPDHHCLLLAAVARRYDNTGLVQRARRCQ